MMGCSQAHQGEPLVHLHKPRGARTRSGRRKPKLQPPDEQTPCLVSFQVFTRKASASSPRCEAHQDESLGAALWITFQAKGVGHVMGRRGRMFLGLPSIYYGMFRGGTTGWKRRDLCDLGRNKCGKVHLCVRIQASNWNGAAASGAHMSRSQQLGRLGSRGQLLGRLSV